MYIFNKKKCVNTIHPLDTNTEGCALNMKKGTWVSDSMKSANLSPTTPPKHR